MFSFKAIAYLKSNFECFLKRKTPFFVCFFLYVLLSKSLNAQEISNSAASQEMTYFSTVNETGGYITEKLHQDFWEMMKNKYDKEQSAKIVNDIKLTLDILKDFQAQTWKMAKTSYFARNIMKDETYLFLKEKLEKQNSAFFPSSVIIDNAEKIVTAAASRTAVDLGAGKFYITPELIEENVVGIKGSYERLNILLNPLWQKEYREYALPKINISLLSLYSPDEYHELIQQGDEQVDIHIAQLCVDKNATYEIGSIDYQKGDKKFANFTPEEKKIYIQEFVKQQFAGYSVAEPLMSIGDWRGYEYLKGVAALGNFNIVIMSLFMDSKAFYIKYITSNNLASAGSEFNEFTKRIQLSL
ncbi:MAG: hypothetical protein JSS07_11330 [Proteobacteria bacterium]|nr:hypothetical protein [Pseudomonadota bacterium]